MNGREQLRTLLNVVQEGDVVVITRIDRLARSMKDLQDIVYELKAKGVSLKATEQPIDTGTAAGKCFLDMLGVFAEFETNLRKERQLEGIAKAKAEGVYAKNGGRKPTLDAKKVRELRARARVLPRSQSSSRWRARLCIACLPHRGSAQTKDRQI